ncbi:hypothetical protein HYX06_04960 [Candidatus Woesearchaeota archaeon]|nr:hypothetical protein [Candidatus Woesearchaeota archaeon]
MSIDDKVKGFEANNNTNTVDGRLSSFKSAMRKFTWWDWIKITGFNSLGAVFSGGLVGYGALNVLTTTASFITSNYLTNRKRGFSKKSLQSDFNLGASYTPAIYWFLNIIDRFTPSPAAWAAAYAIGMYPFTAATRAMKYLINKYKPSTFIKGIFKGEPIRDLKHIAKDAVSGSIPSSAKASLYLTLPVAASHYLLPSNLLIASLYPLRTAYRYILERQEQRKKYSGNFSYALPQAA